MNKTSVDKEYEFIEPDIFGIDYILDDVFKDCRIK